MLIRVSYAGKIIEEHDITRRESNHPEASQKSDPLPFPPLKREKKENEKKGGKSNKTRRKIKGSDIR